MKKKPSKLKPNQIILEVIKNNGSIERRYIKLLDNLTHKMTKDIELYISDVFTQTPTDLAITLRLEKIAPKINKRLEQWQATFTKHSTKYADDFVNKIDQDVQRQIITDIKQKTNDNLVIQFDQSNQIALAKAQGVIKENVDLIKDIPTEMKQKLQFELNESIQQGRSYKYFKEKVIEITGVTEKRAELIARDQSFKATSALSHARQAELGIKKQLWDYTNISKEPRKSHQDADGKEYDINKGCLIDGEYIFPGQKINCKCSSRAVLEI